MGIHRLKIGFVYDAVYPYSKGGAEKRIYHLAKELAKRHEVHWIGMKWWDGSKTLLTDEGFMLHGVTKAPGKMYVEHGRRSLLEPLWFGAAVLQWPGLRHMDVIDCSAFPYFNVFSSHLLSAIGRAPMVVTWHEYWGRYWKEYAPKVSLVGRAIEWMTVKASPTAISVSAYTREKLVSAGMRYEQIAVVPNGLELDVIDGAPPLADAPDILFAGRLIQEKRVDLLLEALVQPVLKTQGATCWIVGGGPDKERLQHLADRLGLSGRVTFVPWLIEEHLYGAMKAAKVVALLSDREGFGMVVLEAMAAGTPVVVARGKHSAAPELVRHGQNGLVTMPSAPEVSNALAAIIASPEMRMTMSQEGKVLAQEYSWDVIARQAEAVYLSMARQPKSMARQPKIQPEVTSLEAEG